MTYKLQKKRLIILSNKDRNWTLSIVAKDASSLAIASLIAKLEPKVSSFPVLEASVASSTNATTKSPFLWTWVYEGTVKRLDFVLL